MIRDLLGEPDVLTDNPHYKTAAPRRLWLLQKVAAAEATAEVHHADGIALPGGAPPPLRRPEPGSSGRH